MKNLLKVKVSGWAVLCWATSALFFFAMASDIQLGFGVVLFFQGVILQKQT